MRVVELQVVIIIVVVDVFEVDLNVRYLADVVVDFELVHILEQKLILAVDFFVQLVQVLFAKFKVLH